MQSWEVGWEDISMLHKGAFRKFWIIVIIYSQFQTNLPKISLWERDKFSLRQSEMFWLRITTRCTKSAGGPNRIIPVSERNVSSLFWTVLGVRHENSFRNGRHAGGTTLMELRNQISLLTRKCCKIPDPVKSKRFEVPLSCSVGNFLLLSK